MCTCSCTCTCICMCMCICMCTCIRACMVTNRYIHAWRQKRSSVGSARPIAMALLSEDGNARRSTPNGPAMNRCAEYTAVNVSMAAGAPSSVGSVSGARTNHSLPTEAKATARLRAAPGRWLPPPRSCRLAALPPGGLERRGAVSGEILPVVAGLPGGNSQKPASD